MKTKLLSLFLVGALSLFGTNWTTFTTNNTNDGGIPENSIVRDIFHAQDGRIWITTTKGISIWDGKNWEYLTTATNKAASPLDNIYDINRLGLDEVNEGGISATYGYEYIKTDKLSLSTDHERPTDQSIPTSAKRPMRSNILSYVPRPSSDAPLLRSPSYSTPGSTIEYEFQPSPVCSPLPFTALP